MLFFFLLSFSMVRLITLFRTCATILFTSRFPLPWVYALRCYACVGTQPGCGPDQFEWRLVKNLECPDVHDLCLKITDKIFGESLFSTRSVLPAEFRGRNVPQVRTWQREAVCPCWPVFVGISPVTTTKVVVQQRTTFASIKTLSCHILINRYDQANQSLSC